MIDTEWPMLIFFGLINNCDDENLLRKVAYVLITFSLVASLYAFWEYFSGWDVIRQKKISGLT